MSEVVVSGTLQEILDGMIKIKDVITRRKYDGWTPFQNDEIWIYTSQPDERTCPVCESFALTVEFNGEELPMMFPDLVQREPPTYTLVRPAVHVTYPELIWSNDPDAEGGCRCRIRWVDPENTLAERLTTELQETV